MSDRFFSQLEGDALRELLARTGLRDAAVVQVAPTLHIENASDAAAQLTGLRPLERIDQLLSEQAAAALRACIAEHTPRTVYEELDGIEYRLELIPHRQGALLAFLRDDRADYDGTLRVLHAKGTQYLGTLLADAAQVDDPQLAAHLRRQCLRLHRLLSHSDFLHDPPLTEQLRLYDTDLAALCRDAAAQAGAHVSRKAAAITVEAPDRCIALIEPQLVRTALYNLLSNALQVTPADGDIVLTLADDGALRSRSQTAAPAWMRSNSNPCCVAGSRRFRWTTISLWPVRARRPASACRSSSTLRSCMTAACCCPRAKAAAACCISHSHTCPTRWPTTTCTHP